LRVTTPAAGARARIATPAVGILLAVAVAACSSSVSPSPTGASSPAAVPADSGLAGGDLAPAPSGTAWPGNVPDSVIALGALDEQIAAAGKALDEAITAKDLKKTQAAAKGLVDLVDASEENVTTVQGYAGTKELGDAYAAALAQLRTGAQGIVDGVTKGDSAVVNQGVTDLSSGITLYGLARKSLGNYMEQALSMKKMYLK
jgi:hypothetical protein